MPSFRVVHTDGSIAKRTKISVSFDGGGMLEGITDNQGYINISGSSNTGKIFSRGKEVWRGSLLIREVVI